MLSRKPIHPIFERAVQLLVMLNVIDAVFTSWWVSAGWATEANPIMAAVLEAGVGTFIGTKLLLGGGGALVLRVHLNRRLAKVGLVAVLAIYALVVGTHLSESASQWATGTWLTVAY